MGDHRAAAGLHDKGRPPVMHRARAVRSAIRYHAATGCQKSQRSKSFPPFTTVEHHFDRMRDSGPLDTIDPVLVARTRVAERCEVERIAGIIDTHSVKTTGAGGPRAHVPAKRIRSPKRT